MEPQRQEYKGHSIELRRSKRRKEEPAGTLELLIDGQPVRYGQLPDGSYALHEYAYDRTADLMDLARRFIDYQSRVNIQRERQQRGEQ